MLSYWFESKETKMLTSLKHFIPKKNLNHHICWPAYNRQIFVYDLFLINIHFQSIYKNAIYEYWKNILASTVAFLYKFQYLLFEIWDVEKLETLQRMYELILPTLLPCSNFACSDDIVLSITCTETKHHPCHSHCKHTPVWTTHHHMTLLNFSL